jgi:glycosyltransferase involved in cell wall biosynthesis
MPEPRRILIACKHLPPRSEGGGALTVAALSEALARNGLEITILRAGEGPDPTEWRGLEVHETPYRDRFYYSARGTRDFYGQMAAGRFNHASYRDALRRLVKPGRFDVIHAQNHTTALAAASLREELGVPIVATLRGHGMWCFVLGKCLPSGASCPACVTANQVPCIGGSVALLLPKLVALKSTMRRQDRLARRIDLFLPISRMMAEHARRYGRPMRVVPDLVDLDSGTIEPLPPSLASELAPASGRRRLAVYAGRLAPNKGLDLLVDAAARLPDWHFVIAGNDRHGEYGAKLRARVGELGLTNVAFTGWLPNALIPSLYDSASVVVLPFLREEPLSRAMVEALACGRPLAATAHGGPLDGVEDGRNGVLFAPNAEVMAAAFRRLASMPLDELGRESRRIYCERFAVAPIVGAHLQAYSDVTAGEVR